jgi:hypothetical protein
MMERKWMRPVSGRFVLVVCLVSCGLFLGAGSANATKYAGAFMANGGGARALAMGGAFTAVADDPSATFWNVAGIADIDSREFLVMHSERFGDLIDRDFASFVAPVDWSLLGGSGAGVGITLIRLGVDDIAFTDHIKLDDLNGDGIGDPISVLDHLDEVIYKSDQEYALMLSYGENLGQWRAGASLKFIHQSVGNYSSFGLGADVGLLRPKWWRNLDVGVKLQDITTTYLSWNTGRNELITPAVVPAIAWRQPLPEWNMSATLAASLESRFENRRDVDQYWLGKTSANSHLGLEIGFSQKVFLRGGYDSGWSTEDMTAGAGFVVSRFTIDYAFAGDALDIDEYTHRISATARF